MLPFLLFILVTFLMPGDSLRQKILFGSLVLSAVIILVTEGLSMFTMLNGVAAWVTWNVLCTITIGIILYKHRKKALSVQLPHKSEFKYLAVVFAILLMLFADGALYPPNNWDSLTYHMPRVVHWIQNGSVYPYLTQSYRQIYQSPFTEYFIAHVFLLHGTDTFSFTPQFFFLVCSLVCIYDACSKLGYGRGTSWLAVIVALTVPSVLLQASTTMNDLTIGYFVLTCCYFGWLSIGTGSTKHLAGLGLSASLAVAAKGTGYLMLVPLGMAWLFLYFKKQKITPRNLAGLLLLPAIFLLLNGGFMFRNYQLTHSFLGSADDGYFNQPQNIKALVSNLFRNVALHTSVYPLNSVSLAFCTRVLGMLGINPSDPATSFGGAVFTLAKWGHHEDNAASPLHLVLILASATVLIVKKDKLRYLYLLIAALFFCILFLKWQPWSTRFHLPLFLLSAIPVAAACRYAGKTVRVLILSVCVLYGFMITVFNPIRPLYSRPPLTAAVSIHSPRKEKYYANSFYSNDPDMNATYKSIDSLLKGENTVGMKMLKDIWEYPLLVDDNGSIARQLIFTAVQNPTAKLPEPGHGAIQYFISDDSISSFNYNSRRYYKIAQYKDIYIYKHQQSTPVQ